MLPAFARASGPIGLEGERASRLMSGVVLHIGLHKTATRFLQRAVFASLDPDRFLVNPQPLAERLRARAHSHITPDKGPVDEAREVALREANGRTIVLSEPEISGDMYSAHANWRENRDLVKRLFPEATIVYFVRRPSDWLESAYRQALAKGPGMPIEFFLNFRDGAFQRREARVTAGVRNVNALDLRFLDIYRGYVEAFGADRVYLFRQEHLRTRSEAVHARLAEALGLNELPALPRRVSRNRAFSALAIHLFFPGVYRDPRRHVRSRPPSRAGHRLHRRLRKLRTVIIRHLFDKLIYRDRDLLARHGMRARLDQHYADADAALSAVAEHVLRHGPGVEALRCIDTRP